MKVKPLLLPTMQGCHNCGECCGPAHATPEEAAVIGEYITANGIGWQEQPDVQRCGFLRGRDNQCAIYPVRPLICRMFGVVEEMPCSYHPEEARQVSVKPTELAKLGYNQAGARLLAEWFALDGGAAHSMVASIIKAIKGVQMPESWGDDLADMRALHRRKRQ